MANVSADLTWALVRNTSSFLKTNKADGAVFSTEPMNLTGKNSFKYSGLANASVSFLFVTAILRGGMLTLRVCDFV